MENVRIELSSLKKTQDAIGFVESLNQNFRYRNIEIDFSEITNTYSKVAVVVCGQIMQLKKKYSKKIQCINLSHHLSTIGICSPLIYSYDDQDKIGKVVQIMNEKDSTNYVEEIIIELTRTINADAAFFEALNWMLFEIIDNAFRHSGSDIVLSMVEHHTKQKHIGVAVFDIGIGIYNSLSKSKEFMPSSALDALKKAIEKGVTKGDGQGFGLYGMQKLVKSNQGQYSIVSSGTWVSVDSKGKFYNGVKPITTRFNVGTLVEFQLNYNNHIDLMKALDGHYPPYLKFHFEKLEEQHQFIRYLVKDKSFGYSTRPAGKKMRLEVINMLKITENRIIIDFVQIDVVSSSFADEFIAKLMLELGPVQFNRLVRLENVSTTVSKLIDSAYNARIRAL